MAEGGLEAIVREDVVVDDDAEMVGRCVKMEERESQWEGTRGGRQGDVKRSQYGL